ncbi:MAG: Gfo/Idh/MocA family oxidoreductase, partial [Chloroflexi bacterium]|nr:Gfo/Idh/MocA family oxidoreductase [Chloroflexota bacterium]
MMEALNIAILGAGDMAGRHARAWSNIGHRVVSVTDIDRARANDLAEQYGARAYADFREAVADPGTDVISICLPLALHAKATIAAANHHKHVITEKPLCRTFSEADAMERAVQAAGVHFAFGLQRNLAEGVDLLRTWAAEGRFGRPMLFSSDLLMEVRPKRLMHDREGNNG